VFACIGWQVTHCVITYGK